MSSSFTWIFIIKKATTLLVAFFVSQIAMAISLDEVHPKISEARKLLLNGKRVDALKLLTPNADDKESVENQEIFKVEGQKIASYFVTENGQKLFELGESMVGTNPDLAEEKYTESLKLEGENLKILNSLSLLYIVKNKCLEAKNWAKRALEAFPLMDTSRAIHLQTLDCLDDFEGISSQLKEIKKNDTVLNLPSLRLLVIRNEIRSGSIEDGLKKLRDLGKSESDFPEVWYWRWKLDPVDGQILRSYLERYLKICKTITPRLKRLYKESGVICLRTAEAKKALNDSGVKNDESSVN